MGKVFVVDISLCSGCHNCQIACKDEHCGRAWLPYAEQLTPGSRVYYLGAASWRAPSVRASARFIVYDGGWPGDFEVRAAAVPCSPCSRTRRLREAP